MAAKKPVRVGFLGFGEAAQRFASDFHKQGLKGMVAYSRAGARAKPGDAISRLARECGVTLVDSPQALAERSDVIFGLVPGARTIAALRTLLPHLRRDHVYADASTAAVKTMERAAALVGDRAGFADAAIMGPVPLGGIRTLIVTAGPAAPKLGRLLRPWGMNLEVVSERPGAASAMKLIRSVCFKGLACILVESLEAAARHGIMDVAARDIARTFDERPFLENMKRFVCGTSVHAGRRVHEMGDVMSLLNSLGSSTRMTRATTGKLKDVAALGLREKFGGREPDDMAMVMREINRAVDRLAKRK